MNKTEQQPTEWEKIFANPTSNRGLISTIFKELKELDIKIPNNPILKLGTDLNREFSAEESQMTERYLKGLLNILNHQGNENQNDSEIPSYTCQNG